MLWMTFVYLTSIYEASFLYRFFYQHVFFFKYIRNFQFFLWWVVLPVYILLCGEHLRLVWQEMPSWKRKKGMITAVLTFLHGGAIFFLARFQEGVIVTSFVTIIFSYLFFLLCIWSRLADQKGAIFVIFLLLVIIQPLEANIYLARNASRSDSFFYYRGMFTNFRFLIDEHVSPILVEETASISERQSFRKKIYYSTKWYYDLLERVGGPILDYYRHPKLYVYDNVVEVDETKLDSEQLKQALAQNENMAFVSSDQMKWQGIIPEVDSKVSFLKGESPQLQIEHFDANSLVLRTDFPVRKFLVYNDSFYPGWQAYRNGRRVELSRANIAFKGIWVPPGKNEVKFHYGTAQKMVFPVSLLILFWGTGVYLLCLAYEHAFRYGSRDDIIV